MTTNNKSPTGPAPKSKKRIVLTKPCGTIEQIDNNRRLLHLCALHSAVSKNSLKMLEFFVVDVLHPDYDFIDCRNIHGETPLLSSIKAQRSDLFIKTLIEAGSDVNATNSAERSALHVAIDYHNINIAHELIKKGADINKQDKKGRHPLHAAVYKDIVEITCMLLYYGADVNIPDHNNYTALQMALYHKRREILQVLINYYDLSKGDVNYFIDIYWKHEMLFLENTAELFKLVWPRFDYEILLNDRSPPFVSTYLNKCDFPPSEWTECLCLILKSEAALDLIKHYERIKFEDCGFNFLKTLLHTLLTKKIGLSNRIAIIYVILSLGFEIYSHDINSVIELFGFNEELTVFIYSADYCGDIIEAGDNFVSRFPLSTFILCLEDDFSIDNIFQLFVNQIKSFCYIELSTKENHLINALGFFSLPADMKQQLLELCDENMLDCVPISRKLQKVPEFPSLLELCRNNVYKILRRGHKIKYPYRFHDKVRSLNVPQRIKDVICFKSNLY